MDEGGAGGGEEKSPDRKEGLENMYSFVKNSSCYHPAVEKKNQMKNCSVV